MLDIVIVNWNSGGLLKKCLTSFFIPANENIINRVYLVDNNSTDGSLDDLPGKDKISLIKNTVNEGFSKAANQGFRQCKSNYVLLLNPDTELLENTLSESILFMDEHKEIDIMGCQLLDETGNITPSCARFITPLTLFYDASGLSKIAPRLFKPATLMTDWDHKESRTVDQVMGAFMFMRLSIFEKIGNFDEQFFVYCEELDFSLRLAKTGGKSFFNANIKAIHIGEGTTTKVKAFRLFLLIQSRLLYAKKHFSTAGYVFVALCYFFLEPFSRFLFLLVQGRFIEIANLFQAYFLLFKSKTIKKNTVSGF